MLIQRVRGWFAIFRGYLLVVAGTGFARTLSFVTAVILARELGVTSFGEISVFLAFLGFWVGNDFLDQTFVRYANAPQGERPEEYLRAVFVLKILLNAGLLVTSFPISRLLATTAFHKPSLSTPIFAGLVCGVGLNFLSLRAATYQADERFGRYTATSASFYVLTFATVVPIAFTSSPPDTERVYGAYVAVASLVGLYSLVALKRVVRRVRFHKRLIRVILSFSRWLFADNVAYILHQRLDVFLLTAFASLSAVGEYSAAVRVVQIVSLLTGTLAPALLPRATRTAETPALLRAYLKHAAVLSGAIAVLVLLIWLPAPAIFTLFFGDEYSGAATVARILLIGTGLVGVYVPLAQLLLAYNQPHRMFYLAALKLSIIAALGFGLVPRYGATGAALAVTLSEAVALGYILLVLRDRIRGALAASPSMTQ
ncbi:MAG: oligosaccharide flippase family protein [Actinomycetota bacterium]|nr:oligosaccharide flippase family protein [Actinomycetota bacterium]